VPPPGSPLESLFLLVWRMRQDIKFYKHQAIVQTAANPKDGESITKAWARYTDAMFPYQHAELARADQAAMSSLTKVVEQGALTVRPTVTLVKSRFKRRVTRVN